MKNKQFRLEKLKYDAHSDLQCYFQDHEENTTFHLNPHIGNQFSFEFTGNIYCSNCHKKTKKSFNQGYCYPCFIKLPECDLCILKPESCHFDKGTCRDSTWGEKNCMIPHYVYLANTSGLKVGITRTTQTPTRWLDQGATWALPILEVKNRLHSGLIEVEIAKHVADKTNWQQLLKGKPVEINLSEKRAEILESIKLIVTKLDAKVLIESTKYFNYPVLKYPEKIKSLNPEKDNLISGTLLGVKGQYLIFDTGVINIRKFTGYEIKI